MSNKQTYGEYIYQFQKSRYDTIRLLLPKGKKEEIKKYAESSMNDFICRAIEKALEEAKKDAK